MVQGNPPAAGTKAASCAVMLCFPPCLLPASRSPTTTPPKPESKLCGGGEAGGAGEAKRGRERMSSDSERDNRLVYVACHSLSPLDSS